MVFQSKRSLYEKTERAFEANRIYGHLNLVKRFFLRQTIYGLVFSANYVPFGIVSCFWLFGILL